MTDAALPPSPAPPRQLPPRDPNGHKGTYGRVLLVGGSRGMAGSISLSAMAALRTGSGLVSAAVPDRCLETVAQFDPALMTLPLADTQEGVFAPAAADALESHFERFDAVGMGPGMRPQAGTIAMVRWAVQRASIPRVLDADGLNALAEDETWPDRVVGPLVMTPHPGEWKRLCGVGASDREAQCRRAERLAAASGAVIVLKGARTFVTDGRQAYENTTGNPGMATGGSGDVLTGVITSLLGQQLAPYDAARLGVWLQGRAGDLAAAKIGEAGMTACDLLHELPAAVQDAQSR